LFSINGKAVVVLEQPGFGKFIYSDAGGIIGVLSRNEKIAE
jgi:hypothetical protein